MITSAILGVGTDIIRVKRLQKWVSFSYDQLRRVFSKQELIDSSHPSIRQFAPFDTIPDGITQGERGRRTLSVRPECLRSKCIEGCGLPSLAARFAAKEAFFKALSAALVKLDYTNKEFTLLFLCRHVSVVKSTWDVPVLKIDWTAIEEKIEKKLPVFKVELSISHEKEYAVAFVVIAREF